MKKFILASGLLLMSALPCFAQSVENQVTRAAMRYSVPVRLAHAVIQHESGYRCNARGRGGAIGPGQLMPATARALGVNPRNCWANIDASMRYLREALDVGGAGCAGLSLYNMGSYARPRCTHYGRVIMRLAARY